MNKFIGIGRNTKDGEYRTSESGITTYSNSLAIKNTFKNKEGNYDSEFINYVAYRQTADYLNKYSSKGTLVNIEGRIHTRSYEDKDKIKRYVTEVIVENANVLDKKKEDIQEEKKPEETIETPKSTSTYDNDNSDIALTDEDIDKVFNDNLDLPF